MPVKRQTGKTYVSSPFAKTLAIAEGKLGKTAFTVGQMLGVFPNQREANSGGVVSRPEHLHVFAFDPGTLSNMDKFLRETCKAPEEALNYDVLNFQSMVDEVFVCREERQEVLYNAVMAEISTLRTKVKPGEVHAVVFSSLSVLAGAIQREFAGPPEGFSNMDMNKWAVYSARLADIRGNGQQEAWHCWWEGHIFRPGNAGQQKKGEEPKEVRETILIEGKQGLLWAGAVEQIFRVRRERGVRYPGTPCDKTYLDTRPALEGDFLVNGRGFNESLAPKEYNLTETFAKLGLKVGRWGRKAKVAAAS